MRRLLPALLLILLPCTLAVAGPSKEFKDYGFKWTLPSSDWTFIPTSAGEKSAGFVAKVECSAASVEIWAYVKGTEGLSLGERVDELQQAGGEGLGNVVKTKVLDTTVSGVKGKVVVQKIEAEGAEGHFRKYAIVSRGKFYQLLVRCWHGAHLSMADEINAARQGFRLLKGAGGEDQPESMDEVEGKPPPEPSGDGDLPEGHPPVDRGGADKGKDVPKGAPVQEGRTIKLHHRNVEWTLPEDSIFSWSGMTSNANQESGMFMYATAKVQREKKEEYQKDEPDFIHGRIELLMQPAKPGFDAVKWVQSGDTERNVVKIWKWLDEVDAAKTRVRPEVKLGNHTAAHVKFEGKFQGEYRAILVFTTALRGEWVTVRAKAWGFTDAYKLMYKHVGKALRGLRFLKTQDAVRGPLLGVAPPARQPRGKYLGEEKKVTGIPLTNFVKPKELARIMIEGDATREIKLVSEGRSEDGQAYLYFEIRYFRLNVSRVPNPDPEKFIHDRAKDWSAGAGDDVYLGAKKGVKIKKGKFAKAKGVTYEFTGHLDDVPFKEKGWIVKHKNVMLWFKMQFGGVDAETKLKDLAKDIEKAVKFKK